MNTIIGNLIELAKNDTFDVIVHGCNCFNTMGAGIALEIKRHFPEAYLADLKTKSGDKSKLGNYSVGISKTKSNKDLIVVNAYTQYYYGQKHDMFEYDKFSELLEKINRDFVGRKIGLPLIGTGLARGNKDKILEIIKGKLIDIDYTVVEYVPNLNIRDKTEFKMKY